MAAMAVKFTPYLPLNQPTKSKSLSSSSSISFTSNLRTGCGSVFGLSATRPAQVKTRGMSCNCLFGLGVPELAVIVGVTALVFGPKQIPQVGKSIGKTVKSFQQAAREFESELRKGSESTDPSSETITQVSEEVKQEVKVSITKENF